MSLASDPAPLPKRLGEYEVLFELATGGMASVFLARQLGDAGFERLVALKRVHPHLLRDPEVFAMASDEARLAALVRHPNVVPVIGVIDSGGELSLVQEYVEGGSASALVRRLSKLGETLEPAIAVRIVCDALRGLHAAHEARDLLGEPLELVHRDISPQNLMVGTDGITRVIDFGIARAERRLAMTKSGIVKGKIHYMAPEQIEELEVDRRADLFAMGAVLFELLSGERPFGEGSESVVMGRVLIGDVELDKLPSGTERLREPLASALATRPEHRPATALELSRAISSALPPADEEQVARVVVRALGAELAARRDRIRFAVGRGDDETRDEEDELGAREEPTKAAVPSGAGPPAAAPEPAARSWLWPIALGVSALLGAIALVGGSRTNSHGDVSRSAFEAPQASLPARPSTTATTTSALPAVSGTVSSSANEPAIASARPSAGPKPAARPSASMTAARSSELLPSPYPKP